MGSCRRKPYREHLFDEELENQREAFLQEQIAEVAKQKSREGTTKVRQCIMM